MQWVVTDTDKIELQLWDRILTTEKGKLYKITFIWNEINDIEYSTHIQKRTLQIAFTMYIIILL